jgi:hypothetical protein
MRFLIAAACSAVCLASLPGCGPSVSREDLGEVMFALPKLRNVSHNPPPIKVETIKSNIPDPPTSPAP